MCNQCDKFKWAHSEYNYCPICGNKLKGIVFIPGCRLDNKLSKNKDIESFRRKY